MKSSGRGQRCLVCDELTPEWNRCRSIFEHSSDMDNIGHDLSKRLEIILDAKLSPEQLHSTEICHLCEAKAVQIEEYFSLLVVFRELFKKTWKKYAQYSKKRTSKRKNTTIKRRAPPANRPVTIVKSIKKEPVWEPDSSAVRKSEDALHTSANSVRSYDNKESLIDSVIVNDSSEIPKMHNFSAKTSFTTTTTTTTTTNATTLVTTKRFLGKRKYKCIGCSKVFANMRNLKRHQVKHSENHTATKYCCPACKQSFTQINSVLSHIKLHKAEGVEIFPCDHCSHLFLHAADLRTHKEKVCARSKKHKCTQCNLWFRCTSELVNHEMTHVGNKPFKCSICAKSFSRKQILKEHSRLHSGERPYKCSQCSAAFCFRSGLNFHVKKVHLGNRPHKCTLCNKTFAVITNLHSHLRIHTGEKHYLCPECGRGFAQAGTLQLHLATHVRDRPYKCRSCNKSFKRMDTLQRHMLTHMSDQPYKCGKCENVYRHQHSLKTHMLTHSDSKPYTCTTCGKGFKRKVALHEHARLHTGEKSHCCDRCGKEFALQRYLKKHLHLHAKDPLKSVVDVNNESQQEEAGVMAGMVVEEVVVTEATSVESPEVIEGTEQPVNIDLGGESITSSNTGAAGTLLLPVDLHQPYTTQHHFQPEPHLTEHVLTEFNKPLPIPFQASPLLQPKPQCLTMSNAQASHDFIYLCTKPPEMPSTMNRVSDTRIVSYAYTISQPEHQAALPHMSDAFNETLNLKMEKYTDDTTRELCMATPSGSVTCSNDEAVQSSMTLVQAHDQLMSGLVSGASLYPRHHPGHIQEYLYH